MADDLYSFVFRYNGGPIPAASPAVSCASLTLFTAKCSQLN